jgi:hypothetical protein
MNKKPIKQRSRQNLYEVKEKEKAFLDFYWKILLAGWVALILGGLAIFLRIYEFNGDGALIAYTNIVKDEKYSYGVKCETIRKVSDMFGCCGLRNDLGSFASDKNARLVGCCNGRVKNKIMPGCKKQTSNLNISYSWFYWFGFFSIVIHILERISINVKNNYLIDPIERLLGDILYFK